MRKPAVILLSGGLDSSTCLAIAKAQGFECHAISFDYGQRGAAAELAAAARVCAELGVNPPKIFVIDLGQFGHSALTDLAIDVPTSESSPTEIPITYVPARNTVLLSIALSLAETLGAFDIFYGANNVDYSGYIDCRPEFIAAFTTLANLATKAGVERQAFNIQAPLLSLRKSEIIQAGINLGLDYSLTVSCYQADSQGRACGVCESCRLRAKGFADAGIADPTQYYDDELLAI